MAQGTTAILNKVTGISTGWAVVMIVLGFLSVVLPMATGIGVSVVVSWMIVLGGVAHVASAFASRNAGAFLWRLLIGLVYIGGGTYLAIHPELALESLTVVMALIFTIKGGVEIAQFFRFRTYSGSGWILFDGILSLFLAFLIWSPWPSSSTWAIGTILGIDLMFSGFTTLMYSQSMRKSLAVLSS